MNDAKVPNNGKVNTVMEGIDIFIKIAEETDKLETIKKKFIDEHDTLADRSIDLSKRHDMKELDNEMEKIEDAMDVRLKKIDSSLEKMLKQGNELSKKMEKFIDNLSSDEVDLVVSELNKKIEDSEQELYMASELKKGWKHTEEKEKARNEEIKRNEISVEAYKYFRDLLGPISFEIVKPGSR